MLSQMYERELMMKKNIKEVEQSSRKEIDLEMFGEELNETNDQYKLVNVQQIENEYETDEEDYERLQEVLGLK